MARANPRTFLVDFDGDGYQGRKAVICACDLAELSHHLEQRESGGCEIIKIQEIKIIGEIERLTETTTRLRLIQEIPT